MKKIFLLLTALFFIQQFSSAQYYNFSKSTGKYSEIRGTSVFPEVFTEFDVYALKLPFTFNYFGKDFQTLYLGTGYASFTYEMVDLGDGTEAVNMSGYEFYVFDSFDKEGVDSASVIYNTTGTAGNRILKIQWKGITYDSDESKKDFANGQLWLYEKGNTIEFHYGTVSILNPETLSGTNGGFIVSILNANGSDGFILSGDASNPTAVIPTKSSGATVKAEKIGNMIYTFTASSSTPVLSSAISEKIVISPNPFNDKISIQNLSGANVTSVKVYNMEGLLINSIQGNIQNIATDAYSSGIYHLVITTTEGTLSRKLVK